MFINKAVLLLATCLVCTVSAYQESEQSQKLERMIIKTDIEAVKKILPNVTLNIETKQNLINLANDIMLMRLKTEEIYSPSNANSQNVAIQDKETLKKIFSKKAIEEIKKLDKAISFWSCADILSYITMIISICATDSRHTGIIGLSCLSASFIGILFSSIYIIEHHSNLQNKIRSNLRQLYCDSIEIKALIAKAPVTESIVFF